MHKMCLMVWKRRFYGNVDLSTTCQCRQLKLNLLSMQIKIYCLLTNQTPALLVQRASWTRAAVMLLQSLYFSPPPPLHPRAIIIPSVHLKIKIVVTVRRGMSKRSHEKIGDCEQSRSHIPAPFSRQSRIWHFFHHFPEYSSLPHPKYMC